MFFLFDIYKFEIINKRIEFIYNGGLVLFICKKWIFTEIEFG